MTTSFDRYRQDWEVNARVDPMWAVLSLPGKMGGGWNAEEFFQVGEREIAEIFRFMTARSIELEASDKALDFGSGLGRLTEALARRFKAAVGIDISRSMVESAASRASALRLENLTYVLSGSSDLSHLGVGGFDFIYSNITLQHLNGDLQKAYIGEFGKLLRAGGVAAFQIPSFRNQWRNAAYLRKIPLLNVAALIFRAMARGVLPWRIRMEFNMMQEADVNAIARDAGLLPAALGYVDWDLFYREQAFRLADAPNPQSVFPVSPLYFFRKAQSTRTA